MTVAIVLPTTVLAQSMEDMDADGDALLSFEEVQGAFPDVTADQFNVLDLNADGVLDAEEVAAAQEAGLMPAG
ncbi:EF-hand domain-containing protein [Sulfitobacter sp. S190]|nr:EF-hand domain-containing protein [Sulfitobacter sp. S190]